MPLPVEALAKQVLDLAPPDRARLLDEVIRSLEADADPSVLVSGPLAKESPIYVWITAQVAVCTSPGTQMCMSPERHQRRPVRRRSNSLRLAGAPPPPAYQRSR